MRKLYLIAVLLFTSFCSYSQFINLPDTNFRNALIPIYPTCFNAAKQLDTTKAKTQNKGSLQFLNNKGIKDVTGVEYFSRLTALYLDYNPIETIIKIPATCRVLSISYSSFSTLPNMSSLTQVTYLKISGNNLTNLINLPPNLSTLDCSKNLITNYSNLPSSLRTLDCSYNNLSTFSFNGLASLTSFSCTNNNITQLPSLPVNLKSLDCSSNSLTSLPNLPNLLTELKFSNNQISSLQTLPTNLSTLDCSSNNLTSLPSFPQTLLDLNFSYNQISNLPFLPKNLQMLFGSNNNISLLQSLDTLHDLREINFSYNKISSIPQVSNRNSLYSLEFSHNQITQFPVFNNGFYTDRIYFDVGYNLIRQMPDSVVYGFLLINNNPILELSKKLFIGAQLNCSNTLITKLPDSLNFFYLYGYHSLICNNNTILEIPNTSNLNTASLSLYLIKTNLINLSSLKYLQNLVALVLDSTEVSQIPQMPKTLGYLSLKNTKKLFCLPRLNYDANSSLDLYLDSTRISCLPNSHPKLNIYNAQRRDSTLQTNGTYYYFIPKITLPLCNPTNNINNCQSNPPISSNIYFDYNNNNTKDANEPFATNIGVRLTNFNRTTTNTNGAFTLYADTIGTQTVTVTAPRFYSAVPNNITINLTRYDTSVTLSNIALQVTTFKDSLSTKITPIHWAARPGFKYPYLVQFKNVGSTTINANASLSYNNALLNYDSSSNNAVTNTGTQLNLALNNFVPGQERSYIAYFKVKPSGSLLGQVLKTYSNITGGTATAIDSTRIIIAGSYDPNDKLSTTQLSTTQVAEGQFINYTIRFQNTGTDTAFTVVIADTLNSLLQANTFEMLGSSHTCKTIIQDNKLYFEFRDILLPDSTTNLIGSNGFVNFRIKPVSSVVLNTVIPNKAAIYFDYNEPIITNTATTTISNTILPTHLLGFNAALQSNKTVLLYWNTTNEINTQFFVVEQSTNAKDFEILETISAKGSGNNSYYTNKVYNSLPAALYYRLKTIDKDGSISYSNIIKIKQAIATGWSIVTNPAKGKLLIEVKDKSLQNTQARLVNAQGQVVQTINVQIGFNSINVSNLNKGLYYVQTNEGTKQVVVE